jgi:hypothetical protein
MRTPSLALAIVVPLASIACGGGGSPPAIDAANPPDAIVGPTLFGGWVVTVDREICEPGDGGPVGLAFSIAGNVVTVPGGTLAGDAVETATLRDVVEGDTRVDGTVEIELVGGGRWVLDLSDYGDDASAGFDWFGDGCYLQNLGAESVERMR